MTEIKEELAEKVLKAELANIVKKVKDGKTLNSQERKVLESSKQKKPYELLNIQKATYYKYLKLGMPETLEEAKEWITLRAGLALQGSGKIEIGGKTFTAKDLVDLRGKLLEGQAENIVLKNRIEKLNIDEREGKLVDADELSQVLARILYPLRKALDQLPENIASSINPDDPSRAETILEQELENIYEDLCRNLSSNEKTKAVKINE